MQKAAIAQIINHQFSSIHKLVQKLTPGFDKQTVYELRLELKKLRAFLELVRSENGDGKLRMRRRLKQFNGYIGIIRNIQLQQHLMQEMVPAESVSIDMYLQQLNTGLQGWKKEVMKLLFEHTDFEEERIKLLKELPDKLSETSVYKFLQGKTNEIENIFSLQAVDEQTLHLLRRLLKDLLYTWPYIKGNAATLLPTEINSLGKIQMLADLLGSYGDQCAALDLLHPAYIEGVQLPQGRELLRNVCTQLEQKKTQLRLKFFSTLLKQKQQPVLLTLE